jgi:glycosyltransferase involved in cell wall biosynthesis
MKILVVDSVVPFESDPIGGMACELVRHLKATGGIESELLRIPYRCGNGERMRAEMDIYKNLRLENVDRVIALGFPAYFIPHHDKTIWLLHQPGVGRELDTVSAHADSNCDDAIRLDVERCFVQCRGIFAGSLALQRWLATINNVSGHLLRPPAFDAGPSLDEVYGDGIFATGVRTREHLQILLRAMSCTNATTRVIIAGVPPKDSDELRQSILAVNLGDRIVLAPNSEARDPAAQSLLRNALACIAFPSDDDLLGLGAIEAFAAGKAVLAVTGSAVHHEIVSDGENGCLVRPTAEAVADAMTSLFADRVRTIRMGHAGRNLLSTMGLTWPKTVKTLLECGPSARGAPANATTTRRNDLCACGSGKRYKHCHGRLA